MIDFNCYVGMWPFYKLRRHTFEDLKAVHKKNNIDCGYVSSVHSIFYNDIYESEKDLYNEIKGSNYKQVTIVNPTVGSSPFALKRCIREFDIKGVRIFPGFHGYSLTSDVLKPILEIVRDNKLPLFITYRMHDERTTHMLVPEMIKKEEVIKFNLDNPDILTILSHLTVKEANELLDVVKKSPILFTDTTYFTNNIIGNSNILDLYKNAVFGSGFPLRTVTSGMVLINTEIDDNEVKEIVLNGTAVNKYLK